MSRRMSLIRWVPFLRALAQAAFKTAAECLLMSPHSAIMERSDSGPRASRAPLGRLAALLTQYRRSVDPITAGGQNRGAQAACSQGVAELAGLPPSVHPNLFHALVKDPYATAIP